VAEVLKWDGATTGEGVTLYTTLGASDQPMDSAHIGHRVEFFIGLRPERDQIASPLADLALYPTRQRVVVDHGHTIPADKPFWPGTAMHHFLVSRTVIPIIEPLELEDGTHVEFLQVMPIFESELSYKRQHGADGLLARWKQREVAFWNPDRQAEPSQF
jgi:hypothetical protein